MFRFRALSMEDHPILGIVPFLMGTILVALAYYSRMLCYLSSKMSTATQCHPLFWVTSSPSTVFSWLFWDAANWTALEEDPVCREAKNAIRRRRRAR